MVGNAKVRRSSERRWEAQPVKAREVVQALQAGGRGSTGCPICVGTPHYHPIITSSSKKTMCVSCFGCRREAKNVVWHRDPEGTLPTPLCPRCPSLKVSAWAAVGGWTQGWSGVRALSCGIRCLNGREEGKQEPLN